jgi:hypothetical protein|tara:strand:- start:156 stop:572 length:417 start_codon:yes stop_codon:yes gene_type:complete
MDYTGIALVTTIIGAGIVIFQLTRGKTGSVQTEILEQLQALKSQDNSETTPHLPGEAIQRLDALELRMEKLHQEALRYLQQGAQRHRRAERIIEEQEENDVLPEQIQMPIEQAVETPARSDLEEAIAIVRQNGITPLT